MTAERRPDDARVRVFAVRRSSVVALQAWLDQLQAHWNEQLRAFKVHAESAGDGEGDNHA